MGKVKYRRIRRRTRQMEDHQMYRMQAGSIVRKQRIPFSSGFQKAMPVNSRQARCHSVSLDCIAAIVENLLNTYVDRYGDEDYVGMIIYNLNRLGHAVLYIEGLQYNDVDRSVAYFDYINKTKELRQISDLRGLVRFGNEIIRILNEAPENLRLGNRRINSSISYSFDPKSWIYVSAGRHITQHSLVWQSGTCGYGDGLYLNDRDDINKIRTICEILSELEMDYPFGVDVYRMEDENSVKYIVASSNNVCSYLRSSEPYQIEGWEILSDQCILLKV